MENLKPKFNIEQDNQGLKLYFFTIQGGSLQLDPPVPEDFRAVMAYNEQGAIEQVKKEYPSGMTITVKKRGEIEVKRVVEVVNIQATGPQNVQIMVTPPEAREKTARDFIYGMMLIADKFVTNKRDQASLKRIISKYTDNNNGEEATLQHIRGTTDKISENLKKKGIIN